MYLYFCMRWWLQLFCSQLQILERRNFVSWKRNFVSSKRYFVSPTRDFASSKRNFVLMTRNFVQRARNFATKFRLMPRNFVSINHLACEISPTLEQQKHRNFAAFSSEAKVRNLIVEIRVISLISANFVCISFAQYSIRPAGSHFWQAPNLQWAWKELRFNIVKNLLCLFFI